MNRFTDLIAAEWIKFRSQRSAHAAMAAFAMIALSGAAFGALHQHRRHDGHHHPEEALPAHTFADIRQGDRRIRPECPVVVI